MIEFSNLIQVTPINSAGDSQPKAYEFIADSFSYIPQLSDNEAGNYWNCDKTLVIEVPDRDVRRFFSIERNAIVKVKTSDRRYYEIGTPNIPARVQISSNLNSANLVIKCKMLTDPML
ncbi:pseudouridylate synthase [Prevotella intermedia]|uniref:pseudouridylate synthase n=1 Tax=Prevotella intermedia TaxID=28131 RepID=UPI000C1BF2A5|nr:pseudouridylate synthase [Prevotella intermedia]ATV32522.1 pseudouridylate synthase [Prevotella intermedia]ATV41067.1 pseudouridylate synthase [Prevotella intermedia]